MDKAILVDEQQITDGQRLVEQLVSDGFDVGVAFWIRFSSENDSWFFYIVSGTIDKLGLHAAYRALHAAIQKNPALWGPYISISTLRLVGLNDPLARGILAIRDRYPDRSKFQDMRVDNRSVEEVYIPAVPVWNSEIEENVKRFLDQGWKRDGYWDDGYPCIQKGTKEVGFLYRIRVDERMTPEKVPFLEGERPIPRS